MWVLYFLHYVMIDAEQAVTVPLEWRSLPFILQSFRQNLDRGQ